ncbi:MarR family winged helix-turn-helix transcriptional regulator [Sulfitobacter noctilucae]|uniref:MarR family winged helix-turn-helix transcriptional regulator n=1 Tax=Sulfitobacter noctilucae TaxID=1342302 RepID=UPI001377D57A|nr:MarR family transcriptional regulator [Sulfitobacter noctilucae]
MMDLFHSRGVVLGNGMSGALDKSAEDSEGPRKHPFAKSIEDVITFRFKLLVAIGERAGQHWSERLFDLSLNEWRLLALVKARAPTRAGDIADLLVMDKSQTSRVVKTLLTKGLVQDRPDTEDGRAHVLELTEKGEALYEPVFEKVLKSNERVLATLTAEEVRMLDSVLDKLIDHNRDLLDKRMGRQTAR